MSDSMRRAKLYEEDGGYIVKVQDNGNYNYNHPKHVFADLDEAVTFIKEFMSKEKSKKKKETAGGVCP